VDAGRPREKESPAKEPEPVPVIQPAGLQQDQSQEPGRLYLAFGPDSETQRQRFAGGCKKAYGEKQAQLDGSGEDAAHDRGHAKQQEQDRGSGFRVIDRESHTHQ